MLSNPTLHNNNQIDKQNSIIPKPSEYTNNQLINLKSSSFTNNQLLIKDRSKTLISSNFQQNTQSCFFPSNFNKEILKSMDNIGN